MVVADKTQSDQIIGTATLILEQKFIRECALKGRVEEVIKKLKGCVLDNEQKKIRSLLMRALEEPGLAESWFQHARDYQKNLGSIR